MVPIEHSRRIHASHYAINRSQLAFLIPPIHCFTLDLLKLSLQYRTLEVDTASCTPSSRRLRLAPSRQHWLLDISPRWPPSASVGHCCDAFFGRLLALSRRKFPARSHGFDSV